MSYCKMFVLGSLLALAACVTESPGEPQDPQESAVDQAGSLPTCPPGDEYYYWWKLGPCGECKLANGHQGQILTSYISCSSDVEGTKISQGKTCGTCLTVPPPRDLGGDASR